MPCVVFLYYYLLCSFESVQNGTVFVVSQFHFDVVCHLHRNSVVVGIFAMEFVLNYISSSVKAHRDNHIFVVENSSLTHDES